MDIAAGYISQALVAYVLPAGSDPTSLPVLFLTYYILLGLGGVFFYVSIASISFFFFFRYRRDKFYPDTLGEDLHKQIRTELRIAFGSIPFMSILMTPFPVLVAKGYSKVYHNVDDYGWGYLLFSIPLFLFCTDMAIYFIHRGLHLPFLYRYIHKPHHTYRFTTPYSSHAFHPIDGWAQGVPYYVFPFFFPLHSGLFIVMFMFVNLWTISIHDQVDFCGGGFINSTGHHTIHHARFNYNYGQYTTLWDRICRSYEPAEQTNKLTGEKLATSYTEAKAKHVSLGKNEADEFEKDQVKKRETAKRTITVPEA